jgi:hypothetical protein
MRGMRGLDGVLASILNMESGHWSCVGVFLAPMSAEMNRRNFLACEVGQPDEKLCSLA